MVASTSCLPTHYPSSELCEKKFIQCLGEDICYLLLGAYMVYTFGPSLYFFPEVVIFNVQMLGPWPHFGNIGYFNGPCIVFKNLTHYSWLLVHNTTGTPISCASSNSHIMGITSLIACDRAIYSASVDDRAISVCILDAQCMGHPA